MSTVILLGVGFYSRAEASRLLKVHPASLNRWVQGYTYVMRKAGREVRRRKPGLIHLDLPIIEHALALSFIELMELRIIKVLCEKGVPLQRTRQAALAGIEVFNTQHPFASRRIFTDQRQIFANLTEGTEVPDVIELKPSRHLQIQSGPILKPILEEITFNERTHLTEKWWPLSFSLPVVLDPKVSFGAPIIDGTRVRTDVAAGMADVSSVEEAADNYSLTPSQVKAAIDFEQLLAA